MFEAHRPVAKDPHIHRAHVADDRRKIHLAENVLVDVDARRHLDQLDAFRRSLKDAALGDVIDRLSGLGGILAAKRHLLDAGDELARCAFAKDMNGIVLHRDLQSAAGERAGEHKLLGALRNVDEAARACELRPEAADIDVAGRVRLRHAETCEIEAATIVEIKLLVLMDHRIGIERGAEIQAALRQAADNAGLGGQREIFQHLLFGRDRRNALGHADAEIDHAARRQFERTAPRDDFAFIKRQRHDAVHWHALPPGKGVAISGAIGLHMIVGIGNDDAIDEDAGNLDLARAQRVARRDALDLHDDEAAGILRGHRHRQIVQRQRLALHRDVAGGIGCRSAQQCDVDRK